MSTKWLAALLGASVLITFLGVSRATNQTATIDSQNNSQTTLAGPMTISSTSSSSSSYSSDGNWAASTTLSQGSRTSLGHGRDTITLEILSADLQPLTYDGAGQVKLRLGLNGRRTIETLSINPRFDPTTGGAYDSVDIGTYTLDLVSYEGDFDNPSFTFELR